MSVHHFFPKITDDRGAAMMQVVFVGALLAITAYIFTQFMVNSDRKSMNDIRRNDNLNMATLFSDFVNDSHQISNSMLVLNVDTSAVAVRYW